MSSLYASGLLEHHTRRLACCCGCCIKGPLFHIRSQCLSYAHEISLEFPPSLSSIDGPCSIHGQFQARCPSWSLATSTLKTLHATPDSITPVNQTHNNIDKGRILTSQRQLRKGPFQSQPPSAPQDALA